MKLPDIDIDLKDRDNVLDVFKHVPATINDEKKHNTGVYFNNIPINPLTGYSSIDYKEAEERGYFKLDLLNVGIYENVKSEEHLIGLMNKEPMWLSLIHI